MERLHTIDIMLSLGMGVGQGAGRLFFYSVSANPLLYMSLSLNISRSLVFFRNFGKFIKSTWGLATQSVIW